jgi:phosphate uptake regulator
MEIRKVQITGGSSFVISLPKAWAKSLNIEKNDPLGLVTQPDGTLLITTKITGEQVQIAKEFDVDNINELNYLFRCLIGAYIAGYDIIKIKSSKKIPPFARTGVREFTQMTIGQEIVEETDTSITVKDLLDPVEMPFNSTIQRMHIIVKSMYEDAINALKNGDKTLAEDVILRDNDVDRLHWLVARHYNIILRNINLAERMGITTGMVVNYFLISRIIERIGDHAVRIVKNTHHLIDEEVDDKIIDDIASASNLALEILDKSIESFNKRDIKASNENIGSVTKLTSLCEEINALALQQEGVLAISLGYIVESIRRMGEYAGDLSEYAIDYLVGNEVSVHRKVNGY